MEFEHVIAAAANVTGEDDFVVIGGQAILGANPGAPATMLRSLLAKCVAGRERDWEFAADALRAGIARIEVLLARVDDLPVPPGRQAHIADRIRGIATQLP